MTALDLDAIETRANAASMAPWLHVGQGAIAGVGHTVARYVSKSDAQFVAHARTDIPALIAEVRRLSHRPTVEGLSQMMREHFFGSDVPTDECDECAREFLDLLPKVGDAS